MHSGNDSTTHIPKPKPRCIAFIDSARASKLIMPLSKSWRKVRYNFNVSEEWKIDSKRMTHQAARPNQDVLLTSTNLNRNDETVFMFNQLFSLLSVYVALVDIVVVVFVACRMNMKHPPQKMPFYCQRWAFNNFHQMILWANWLAVVCTRQMMKLHLSNAAMQWRSAWVHSNGMRVKEFFSVENRGWKNSLGNCENEKYIMFGSNNVASFGVCPEICHLICLSFVYVWNGRCSLHMAPSAFDEPHRWHCQPKARAITWIYTKNNLKINGK